MEFSSEIIGTPHGFAHLRISSPILANQLHEENEGLPDIPMGCGSACSRNVTDYFFFAPIRSRFDFAVSFAGASPLEEPSQRMNSLMRRAVQPETSDRFVKFESILAAGLQRLLGRQSSTVSKDLGESLLHSTTDRSGDADLICGYSDKGVGL